MDLKDATILVVDDEPDWRSIIADWLRREGSCVLLAEDGAEALKLIHTNKIDAVVSDVRMPVMDGITLLKNIKAGL
jgi:two-component system chemotaxis response regulator CheY